MTDITKYRALGREAIKQYPELKNMSAQQAARFIQKKAYKGLPEFRSSLGLGNEIIDDPEYLSTKRDEQGNVVGAYAASNPKGIIINSKAKDREGQLGILMHEYGHQLDDAARAYARLQEKRAEYEKESWLPNPIKKIMKYKDISKQQEAAEAMRKNYPSGKIDPFLDSPEILEFKPSFKDPSQKKDPLHHFKRDFPRENIKRIKKGGLEEVVMDDKFKKLRSLIS